MTFEPRVVAAIDFGTHGTGFAWAVVEDANADPRLRQINYCVRWDAQPVACAKNLTALLLDRDRNVVAWGFDARRRWISTRPASPKDRLDYFAAFKMNLFGPAGSTSSPAEIDTDLAEDRYPDTVLPEATASESSESAATEAPERPIPVNDHGTPDLITAYLRQVYGRALEQITASGYGEDDIRWCLTVPAIWTDYQKQVMRDAAKNAGLPTEEGRLLLALEPEAAAHQARVSSVSTTSDTEACGDLMDPGARFMVVDCGGGTVDITAYENDDMGRMIEIGRVNGGPLGSDFLNKSFEEQLLVSRLGKAEVLKDLREQYPEALLDLVEAWERAKLHIGLDNREPIYLSIPAAIDRHLGPTMRKRLARIQSGISDAIVLQPEEAKGLFDNIVPDILDLVEDQLEEMNRTRVAGSKRDVVLLVGGFGTSPYLQQSLKDRLGERADVLIPPDPNVAVLFGAVHFCYEPHTRARRSRFTYGCDVSQPFEEGIDPEDTRYVTEEGRVLCADRFSRFVAAGETVPVDAEVVHRYFPVEGTQTTVTFNLLATTDPDPRYCTDADQIGYFEVDISRVMRFALDERGVRLHMRFGETEVKVRAVVELTGEEVAVTSHFHSNH